MSALFQRCILEANHKRTIERSLAQLEYLIEQLGAPKTPLHNRFDLFFASGMEPVWALKQRFANMMLNLGMVKGALDLYLKLALWEDVIVCYTILEMKHKVSLTTHYCCKEFRVKIIFFILLLKIQAAEVIKQELAKKPSVKLWCLLGDAEHEPQHYETAWKLSGEKSSRAQRHWGFYHYLQQNVSFIVLLLCIQYENVYF